MRYLKIHPNGSMRGGAAARMMTRMWFAWGLIGLIIWIAICVLAGLGVAARKGHSFLGFFLLSLLFFPLSLILAYASADPSLRLLNYDDVKTGAARLAHVDLCPAARAPPIVREPLGNRAQRRVVFGAISR